MRQPQRKVQIQYIVKWLSPQYAKRQVLENKKIRLGKYITPLRGP